MSEIWYESAGTRLYAVEQGHGEPVIFLHGGLADHRSTLFRVGHLARRFRLIAPDARGAGRSHHAGDLRWELLADDVAALIDHLGLERAVVGGSSMGSAIALAAARRHPRRVRALLLVAPVYAGTERGLVPAQRAAMERMGEAGERVRAEGIEALVPLYDALPAELRDRAVAMARSFDPASVVAHTRFLASCVQPFDRVAELEALTMPAVIVRGADPEHPPEVAELYAQALPGARLVEPTADLLAVLDHRADSNE